MQNFVKNVRTYIQKNLTRKRLVEHSLFIRSFVRKKPWVSFIGILGLLLLLILASSFINRPKNDDKKTVTTPKRVSVFRIGELPHLVIQGKVEKSGVVKITSQMSGIVQDINVREGQFVKKGANLLQLSSTYDGANASAVQRQIAQAQHKNVVDTFDIQKDLIKKQREVAQKTNTNDEELRNISKSSLDETRTLLSFNEELLRNVEVTIQNSQSSPEQVSQAKQLRAQLLSATNQIKSSLRLLEYQTNEDKSQAQLADLGKDIALRQLDIQEKSLEMNKELSRLQLNLALINESLMHPTSPISGIVERVFVKKGESVAPNTPLLVISGDSQSSVVIASVPPKIADAVSRVETSTIAVGSYTFRAIPSYVSTNATDGTLYNILYTVPDQFASGTTDGAFVSIDMPIGYPDTTSAAPYIPLDAVYQTQDSAFVYVMVGTGKQGKVGARKVELDEVLGTYVLVKNGIGKGDRVITNRNVIEDETVSEN